MKEFSVYSLSLAVVLAACVLTLIIILQLEGVWPWAPF